jgi:hypothetical protein
LLKESKQEGISKGIVFVEPHNHLLLGIQTAQALVELTMKQIKLDKDLSLVKWK